MGTITTLRPSATSSGVGWTPSTGTLHGVTSDNSDATYATWGGSGSALILATPVDSPPAGERRHQVRLRMRGEDGDAWGAVRLSSGGLAAGVAAQFPASPSTITGSWGFGAPADGSTTLYSYVTGQTSGVRIEELYVDVDSREAPTFTPQILDGSGTVTTTIGDTAQPVLRANAVDLDDLAARQYRYWVTLNGATVWDTGVVSGTATSRQTGALDNGSYVAHFQVWSTLGQNTAYASDEETLAFTVQVGQVAKPENPTVLPVEGTPFYDIQACAPFVGDLDGGVGYVEIQRVDCPVGGYLESAGAPGSYASTPDPTIGTSIAVLDGNFETDVTGWNPIGGSVAHSTAQAYESTGSALLTVVGSPVQTYLRQAGPANAPVVVPGRTYRTTFWLYAPVAIASITAAIDWFDSGVNYLDGEYDGSSIDAGVWTYYEATGVAPVGAAYANYGPTMVAPDGTQLYIDRVTFEDVSPPTDLEIIVTAQRDDDWRPAANQNLVSHFDTGGNQRAWRLYLDADGDGDTALIGRPIFAWSPDGTTNFAHRATARMPVDPFGVVRLRVLFDTGDDDTATPNSVTFWTRETDDGEWTQLGDVLTGAGETSIYNSTAPYAVGAVLVAGAPSERFEGRFYSVQVRDGAAGTVLANPDFTNHLEGTTTFQDGVGNTWTVHSPASIYSPTSTVTVAMLGPLESDECASWIDFTLPRSGVGLTCDHAPEACCSYYRARTVGREDGDLRISDWSDVYDPGIPAGLIVMWPGTAASIPEGWQRTTELDGRYPKGIPNEATQPGNTGGAATHSHTLPTHTHDTTHGHTVTGNSSAATGTVAVQTGGATVFAVASTHTHTRPSLPDRTLASGATTPTSGTGSNDPARAEVVFIESDGSPLGVPDGAAALSLDIPLSGWDDSALANTGGRYLKGAPAAGNGGTTAASAVASHSHPIDAHTHTGTSHDHPATVTGSVAATTSLFAGSAAVMWTSSHNHPFTTTSAASAALNSGGSGTSGASPQLNPPFRQLRLRENVSGQVDLPVGLICLWRGSIGSIPDNWRLCDGEEGTPDMFGLYPRVTTDAASVGTTGGTLDPHTHTSPEHNHSTGTHSHSTTVGSGAHGTTNILNTGTNFTTVTGTHTHASTASNATTPTVGQSTSGTLASTTTEPPYEEVAFVQLMSEPTPPPEPDVFCLEWDDDEHLIRTNSEDGPLWAPVLGKFEWSVERPFTAATGVMGSRFVTSAAPGGRNLSMTAAVENEAELAQLRAVLARPLVLISPSDANEVWAAPVQESVRIVKIGRIRQVTASFIGTGPEPPPQLADVGV